MRFLLVDDCAEDRQLIMRVLRKAFGQNQTIEVSRKEEFSATLTGGDFETLGRRPFDAHDVAMLQGLAASAAVALENARMLSSRERAKEASQGNEQPTA